jgi:hypothetical protein
MNLHLTLEPLISLFAGVLILMVQRLLELILAVLRERSKYDFHY